MDKLDIEPAYGKNDINKIRLTPETIGLLLSKVPDGDLRKVFDAMVEQSTFATGDRVGLVMTELSFCSVRLWSKNMNKLRG